MDTNKLNDLIEINVCGYDIHDYKDYSGLYLESAIWKSTNQNLTEDELNDVNENNNDWLIEQIDIGDIIDYTIMSYNND